MDVNALSQLYGSDRWPRRAELDGRCERFIIPMPCLMERGFASYGATRCPARAIRTAASTIATTTAA